jgi:hypothetical protein
MRETNFNDLYYEFENYGLEDSPKEPVMEFDFGNELHREYITWAKDFTFAHFSLGRGSMTIGGTRIGDKLYYGVALCSPQDNFSKAKGRAYVREHLTLPEKSGKRGVFVLEGWAGGATPPALLLSEAAKRHLKKMRHKPKWTAGASPVFRTNRKSGRIGKELLEAVENMGRVF